MTIHAYWLGARGPENMSGVELHYICQDDLTPAGSPFWMPSIDWWPSIMRFWAGEKGFNGITQKLVAANYEGIKIHDNMMDAVRAWKRERKS